MPKNDFRDFLFSALADRQKAQPGYSLRGFAAEIGISAQKLNQVLKGRSGLSPESASKIAQRLSLEGKDKDLFVTLVTAYHHRSRLVRQTALEKLKTLKTQDGFDEISPGEFNSISNWFYMAAAILVDVADFQQDYNWIASRLGIDAKLAKETYDKLFEKGFLREEDGRWKRDSQKFMITSQRKDEGLQRYHRDLMSVAEKTLSTEPAEARHFSAAMISVSLTDIDFIKESVDMFRRKLIHDVSVRPGQAERVYGIGIQVFPVDKVATQPKVQL